MPALPTLTVTQAQADRMLAAFGDSATYKSWLLQAIIAEVTRKELISLDEQNNANKQARVADIASSMPSTVA